MLSSSRRADGYGIGVAFVRHVNRRRVVKKTYGFLAGMIGVGAWLWMRRRSANQSVSGRGRVIYSNTPEPSELSGEGVI